MKSPTSHALQIFNTRHCNISILHTYVITKKHIYLLPRIDDRLNLKETISLCYDTFRYGSCGAHDSQVSMFLKLELVHVVHMFSKIPT